MPILKMDRLKALQFGLGWSDRELARRMGFSTGHMSDVLSGKKRVSDRFMDKLCEVFQVKYDVLFVHPSIKIEDQKKERWYDHIKKQNDSRFCRDPEHRGIETVKDQDRVEKMAAQLIPRQVRKRFWGLRIGTKK